MKYVLYSLLAGLLFTAGFLVASGLDKDAMAAQPTPLSPKGMQLIEEKSILLGQLDNLAAHGVSVCDLYKEENTVKLPGWVTPNPESIPYLLQQCNTTLIIEEN